MTVYPQPCLFILALFSSLPISQPPPFLYSAARSCSVPGHYRRTGSQQQICVVTGAGFWNLWHLQKQQQVGSHNQNSRLGAQGGRREVSYQKRRSQTWKMLCSALQMPAKCHPHIKSPSAWESLICDPGAQMHTCAPACRGTRTYKHFQPAGFRTFQGDLHYR